MIKIIFILPWRNRVYGWKNEKEVGLNPKLFTMSLFYSFYSDIRFYIGGEKDKET